jgi:serine/threonine protein kinase
VDFFYAEKGIRIQGNWYPILAMEWVAGSTLGAFLRQTVDNRPVLRRLASLWPELSQSLRRCRIAHGDLEQSNILVVPGDKPTDFDLKLIDYDSMWVPALAQRKSVEVGHPAYQHPQWIRDNLYNAELDRFPHLVIYTALRCLAVIGRPLWDKYDNEDNLLFREMDFSAPEASNLFRDLWAISDPAVHALVGHLVLATQDPPDRVPLLEDLVSQDRPTPLSLAQERQVDTLLRSASARRLDRLKPGWPSPPEPPTSTGAWENHSPQEVQFTVYRPRTIVPGTWYPMLAFTHLAERRPDAPEVEPDPIEVVRTQARQFLGSESGKFRESSVDARQPIPRAGEITLLPLVPGIEFNPDRRVFRWCEEVHREEFRLKASEQLNGQVARGRLAAYFGAILLAEVDLAIKVDTAYQALAHSDHSETVTARPYRKIFASYSHEDVEIVRQYERFVETLGDRYLRDVRDLRAGEAWDKGLLRLIDEADVFQLFWSTHSMASTFVRREWEYALSLNRESFIRPTYWEEPLPESPDHSLPPEVLRRLHFHQIALAPVVRPSAPVSGTTASANTPIRMTPGPAPPTVGRKPAARKTARKSSPSLFRGAAITAALLAVLGLFLGWPPSQDYLFQHAKILMESKQPRDWVLACNEYLDPLDRRFPDNPYKATTRQWRDRVLLDKVERRAAVLDGPLGFRTQYNEPNTDPERQYVAVSDVARKDLQRGNDGSAARAWDDLAAHLHPDDADERPWWLLAQKRSGELKKVMEDRRQFVTRQLRRIQEAKLAGNVADAGVLRKYLLDHYGKYADLDDLFSLIGD